MKKIIVILVCFMLLSCTQTVNQYTITISGHQPQAEEIIVEEGDDYTFTMPSNATFNKTYLNNEEIMLDDQGQYVITDIKEDMWITFNSQYSLNLSAGEGYTLEIMSDHEDLVNENEDVLIRLTIDENYNQSEPTVLVNNNEVTIIDNQFTVNDIRENVIITVMNIIPNLPEDDDEDDNNNGTVTPPDTDYSQYANNDLSWWYRPTQQLNQDVKPTIDPGIASLISQYDVLWLTETTEKVVYLTMDAGYEYETNTTEILDIAKEKDIPITFFITGSYLDNNLDIVKRMATEGHVVANHTVQHLRAPTALQTSNQTLIDDIVNFEIKYKEVMNIDISNYYRPPEGGYSERSLKIAHDLGYTTVFWSYAYRDWLVDDQPDPQEAYNRLMSQLHPGAIILLHTVSDTNVEILGDLIDGIREQGYTIGILP